VITPRLFRRSLAQALQWRLLFLWWASLLVPGAIAALPVFHFFRRQLDHSTQAREVVARLDGATLLDLARQLGENGAGEAMALGFAGGALAFLFVSPFVAGATVAAARSDEPLRLRQLLAGAGELYGRMLRTFLCGLVPLGIGAAIAAGAIKLSSKIVERDLTETAADGHLRNGAIAAAVSIFVFHLLVDAARAQFAAEPGRRSAAAALWSAVRMMLRRPLRALGIGALGTVAGLGGAAVLMVVRLRIEQGGAVAILIAWLLAQAAHLAVGWGRATRICGLAELARADAADRARAVPVDQLATLSPRDASGT
jgi:hypothetical protein